MSDILIGVIIFGLVFGAAIFGMFLDSQSTNYDSRNDLRFAHHVQHPVQKQGRPVPNRCPGQRSGQAECLNKLERTNEHGFKRERPGR